MKFELPGTLIKRRQLMEMVNKGKHSQEQPSPALLSAVENCLLNSLEQKSQVNSQVNNGSIEQEA